MYWSGERVDSVNLVSFVCTLARSSNQCFGLMVVQSIGVALLLVVIHLQQFLVISIPRYLSSKQSSPINHVAL